MSDTSITLDNVYTMREFSGDIAIRAAVYEYANLSILPNGAGSALAYLNKKTNYLTTGMLGKSRIFNKYWFAKNGYKKDRNPFCIDSPNQIWRTQQLTPEEIFDLSIATLEQA